MGWKGMAIGGCLGSLFGGTVGAIFGALIGGRIEQKVTSKSAAEKSSSPDASHGETIFLASAAAMLAKVAKADGVVTNEEIRAVERSFARLGFSPEARSFAIRVFRRAKTDTHTVYEYAAEFALAVRSVAMRELLYELLWDVACADGALSPNELTILRNITRSLAIRSTWYDIHAGERMRSRTDYNSDSRAGANSDPLADAYSLLGVEPTAGMDDVRKAYRAKAKQYHPDTLRAKGMPDEMVAKATDMMAKINDAFGRIEKSRGK